MRNLMILAAVCVMAASGVSMGDTFGTGDNQFTIDFVNISGSTNPTSGIPAGSGFTFTGVANDYRMGTYEITNDQWNKFKAAGDPIYDHDSYWTGTNEPINMVNWYEVAQFVNWLNTSKGYQAAYKLTRTQGTSGYTFAPWSASDAGYDAANPYRNSNAYYFLPTENEWVKAAYWNGTSLQTYATKTGESLYQGNGSNGGWNYDYYTMQQPWAVGSGSQELNGTFDMMGNVWEWMESPYTTVNYLSGSARSIRGGSFDWGDEDILASSYRNDMSPEMGISNIGFRVASIPEPASLVLLGLSGLALRYRKR